MEAAKQANHAGADVVAFGGAMERKVRTLLFGRGTEPWVRHEEVQLSETEEDPGRTEVIATRVLWLDVATPLSEAFRLALYNVLHKTGITEFSIFEERGGGIKVAISEAEFDAQCAKKLTLFGPGELSSEGRFR